VADASRRGGGACTHVCVPAGQLRLPNHNPQGNSPEARRLMDVGHIIPGALVGALLLMLP
jgi:hypothetical protein